MTAPDCIQTDGTISNTSPCICGSTACGVGLYCTKSSSTCSRGNVCGIIDGTTPNSVACACGTTACNAENGFYCTASSDTCASRPAVQCTYLTPSAENSVDCQCGLTDCTSATGRYCESSIHFCGPTCGKGAYRKTQDVLGGSVGEQESVCVNCPIAKWSESLSKTKEAECDISCPIGKWSDQQGITGESSCSDW